MEGLGGPCHAGVAGARLPPGVRIDHLFDHPARIPLVAGWIHREFWLDKPEYTPATFERLLADANDPARIPLSLLALVEGEPAGTVNLIECDSKSRPHLRPWLAALIVVPQHRGKGIGRALCQALVAEARRLGEHELFLGAEVHEQLTPSFSIMRFALAGR